jgi:MFS family permease
MTAAPPPTPAFRRFVAARTISQWGDTFNSVALVVLVFQLTGSGIGVGITVIAEILPVLLLGLVAGAIVDRHPRRAVMVAADLARAAVALGLVGFGDEVNVVYAAAFALSAGSVFFNPAAASALPAMVDEDQLVRANSTIWSAAVISQIALAPVAGALVAASGARPAFAINAASYLISAALLAGLHLPATATAAAAMPRVQQVAEGLRTVRRHRFLATLAGVQALAALSAGATSALLVVLAEDHLDVGPSRFGILIAAIGVGAGFGPLVIRRMIRDVRRPGWLFGPYLLRGGVDLTLAASSSFPVALGALGLYGVGTSTGNITYSSVLPAVVPDRLRGRVFAFYDIVWQTGRLASIGAGGVLADSFGIQAVYLLGGLLLLVAGAGGWLLGGPVDGSGQQRPPGP